MKKLNPIKITVADLIHLNSHTLIITSKENGEVVGEVNVKNFLQDSEVLDKKTTKALFGRNISVTYKDMTVKHRVNEKKGEYLIWDLI